MIHKQQKINKESEEYVKEEEKSGEVTGKIKTKS